MKKNSLHLTYKVALSEKEISGYLQNNILQLFALNFNSNLYQLYLDRENIQIEFSDLIAHLNLATKKFTWLDTKMNEYFTNDPGSPVQPEVKYSITNFPFKREVIINGIKKIAQRADILFDDGVIELWFLEDAYGLPNITINSLWNLFFPGIKNQFNKIGLPYEILFRSSDNPSDFIFHFRLDGIEQTEKPIEFNLPPDAKQKDLQPIYKEIFASKTQNITQKFSPKTSPVKSKGYELMMRGYNLRPSGQDFAWIANQEFLDDIKNISNSILKGLDTFPASGADGPLRIEFDFWSQLQDHFDGADFSGSMHDPDLKLAILLDAFITYTIIKNNKMPDALLLATPATAEEQMQLDSDKNKIQTIIDLPPISGESSNQLDQRKWAQLHNPAAGTGFENSRLVEFAKKEIIFSTTFNLGNPPISDFEIPANEFITGHLFSFDTELVLGKTALITSLKYEAGHIRLDITIPEFSIDFNFTTFPKVSGWNVFIGIITVGGSLVVETNWGGGGATADDIALSFFITPEFVGAELVLTPQINTTGCRLDFTPWAHTVNPVDEVLLLWLIDIPYFISSITLDSWFFNFFASQINSLLKFKFVDWPSFWKAKNAIPISASAILFSDEPASGIWEGHIVRTRFRSEVDSSPANQTAFMITKAYISSWFNQQIGNPPAEINWDPTQLEENLGIHLPDPSAFPDPETGGPVRDTDTHNPIRTVLDCPPPPADGPVESTNVLRITRLLPQIDLPPNGISETAAMFTMTYNFFCGASRVWDIPQMVVTGGSSYNSGDEYIIPGRWPFVGNFRVSELSLSELRNLNALYSNDNISFFLQQRIDDFERFANANPFFSGGGTPDSGPPQLPGEGGFGPSSGHVIEPPSCGWQYEQQRGTVAIYLGGVVIVSGSVILGFSKDGTTFLPEIDLHIKEILPSEITLNIVNDPFTNVNLENLKAYLDNIVTNDVNSLLNDLIHSEIVLKRSLINLGAADPLKRLGLNVAFPGIPVLEELITIKQGNENEAVPNYLINGNQLFWPVRFTEDISRRFA